MTDDSLLILAFYLVGAVASGGIAYCMSGYIPGSKRLTVLQCAFYAIMWPVIVIVGGFIVLTEVIRGE